MPRPKLSSAARRFLRAQAHALKPTVQLGGKGLTDGVVAALDQVLRDHELVKVKIEQGYEGDRRVLAEELGQASDSAVCQVMGRVITLFRPHPETQRKPTSIQLPIQSSS